MCIRDSLNTACSASSQNTTNLSYDMTISSLYPTPLYGPGVTGYNDELKLQLYLTPATNTTHKLVFDEFFGGTADVSSGGTNPTWVVYNITGLLQANNTIVNTTFKWDKNSTVLQGNKTIDELAQFVSSKAAEGKADKNTLFGTKAVLRAYGNTNDQIYGQSVKINKEVCGQISSTPTPSLTPTPTATITPVPQADNFSQVVLNETGDYFYYRSCDMDKMKDEGVDFTKCNNYNYSSEVWTKHSVKSLLIKEGDLVQSKLRSLDIDHRYEYNQQFDYLMDMVFYTAVSENCLLYTSRCV